MMNKILIFSIMREVIPPHTKKEERKKSGSTDLPRGQNQQDETKRQL